ncbi:MAG: nucleotidyltransferase domain-containing protein [Nanoarchaeota archaeon]|nr:nucleotidyltransferase domain-containing protein [Nanoarchaeota archaeon]
MKLSRKHIERLRKLFSKHDFVRVAYIFGSAAEDRQGPLSDIDIAVFMDKGISERKVNERKMMLINEISSVLETDKFDLVVMNDAPLLMNYNIIKNGKVLKSGRERILLETSLMSRYLDRKFYDDMYTRLSLARIAKEGIL